MTEPLATGRTGLSAWMRGDVAALAALLAPDVELLWFAPGEWDCHGKDAVLTLLTERVRSGPPAEVEITELDESTLLVARRVTVTDGPEEGLRPATVVRFRDGLVTHMQQYRSRDEALAQIGRA